VAFNGSCNIYRWKSSFENDSNVRDPNECLNENNIKLKGPKIDFSL
jgi:hypothetical protein